MRAQFLRLKHRRGPMKAIVAVAASMLTAAYYMLRDDQDYHDLGAVHFHRGDHDRLVAGLTRRPPPPRLRGHAPPRRMTPRTERVTW